MSDFATQINDLAEHVLASFRWQYDSFREISRSLLSKAQAVVAVSGISLGVLVGLLSRDAVLQDSLLVGMLVFDVAAHATAILIAVSSMLDRSNVRLPSPEFAVVRLTDIVEAGEAKFHPLRVAGFYGDSFDIWASALRELRSVVTSRQEKILRAQVVLLIALSLLAIVVAYSFDPS